MQFCHGSNEWTVYAHAEVFADGKSETFYMGACPATDLMSFPDAIAREDWQNAVRACRANGSKHVVTVLRVVEDEPLARAAIETFRPLLKPWRWLGDEHTDDPDNQAIPDRRRTRIMEVETGRTFDTIKAAADAFDVHATSISHHLAGRSGYPTVNGHMFKRID